MVIYKSTFTTKPLQIVTVKLNNFTQKFNIKVYNAELKKNYARDYTVAEVSKVIIYCTSYLKLKKYRELGQLIFNAYKNEMIYHAFYAFVPVPEGASEKTKK